MKPALTQFQKDTFDKEFRRILLEAPDKLQSLWDGNIYWIHDIPNIDGDIVNKLEPRLKDKYYNLINKLKDRSI